MFGTSLQIYMKHNLHESYKILELLNNSELMNVVHDKRQFFRSKCLMLNPLLPGVH